MLGTRSDKVADKVCDKVSDEVGDKVTYTCSGIR
jgi:hypothetical protein